ncbi:hypothetical protein OESDEN_12024 [Oesophagostomum dentatum]|uniref:Uncharacterized protein n=1 Tax=Oesophagostomum dentatum TaxID=61180 RepID=A0A0B1SYF5_OESDE|nr:hypothetical protein OESDEN_12024 [Oesophagostomum dentatum]
MKMITTISLMYDLFAGQDIDLMSYVTLGRRSTSLK